MLDESDSGGSDDADLPPRRYSEARHSARCFRCAARIRAGADTAPDGDGWCCAACDSTDDALTATLRWLRFFSDKGWIVRLRTPETVQLADALDDLSVPAQRRGDFESWHTDSKQYATLDWPIDEYVHGLLLDALEYGFQARLPVRGINALLERLVPAGDPPRDEHADAPASTNGEPIDEVPAAETDRSTSLAPFAAKRALHPNSHRRWKATEEKLLVRRALEGATLEQLMADFGRNANSIAARLEKNGINPPDPVT